MPEPSTAPENTQGYILPVLYPDGMTRYFWTIHTELPYLTGQKNLHYKGPFIALECAERSFKKVYCYWATKRYDAHGHLPALLSVHHSALRKFIWETINVQLDLVIYLPFDEFSERLQLEARTADCSALAEVLKIDSAFETDEFVVESFNFQPGSLRAEVPTESVGVWPDSVALTVSAEMRLSLPKGTETDRLCRNMEMTADFPPYYEACPVRVLKAKSRTY